MTRRQLADASSTSERYLAHLESGNGNPTLAVLGMLSQALNLAPSELLPMGGERDQRRAEIVGAVRRLSPAGMTALEAYLSQAASHGAQANRVVLVGLRGAGKSSLGRVLADRLGFPFFEISKEVEKSYGGSMRVLVELSGQEVLRRYEREIWEEIVATNEQAVIAAPGGIVADAALYSRVLEAAHSIWLQASAEDHMQRVVDQGDFRPMASAPSAMEDLRLILQARSSDYGRADLHLDTSRQDFDQTAELLYDLARSLIRQRKPTAPVTHAKAKTP